jgi:uncharacterized protein
VSASCIYEGSIRHRRIAPRMEFEHRIALFYLDLDELPGLLEGRLLRATPGILRFRRHDYHGPDGIPLSRAVRETVHAQTGSWPTGPIRLLTQPRCFGHCFNPVSFYYCLSEDGTQLQAILAEVTNTPWGERHAYALPVTGEGGQMAQASFPKLLHVSPFMSMDHTYLARGRAPGQTLSMHVQSRKEGACVFDATLSLRRKELDRARALRFCARYPFATLRVLALIYARAARLKLAGATVHPHPARGAG